MVGRVTLKSQSTNGLSKRQRFHLALPADEERILELLVDLHRKVGGIYGIDTDAASLIETARHVMRHGVCLVGESACAGGSIVRYPWNRSARIGTVLFWNFNRPSGIHVLAALAEEFKARGATHLACSSHFPTNRVGRHYVKSLDMKPVEVQYLLKL